MSVKVSPKYQVVIPEDVRSQLGLKPGTIVEVIAKGKVAYIVPVLSLKELRGELTGRLDQAELRDKRGRSA
jgi:AbrB family looped-hinge helix DNA binding protein